MLVLLLVRTINVVSAKQHAFGMVNHTVAILSMLVIAISSSLIIVTPTDTERERETRCAQGLGVRDPTPETRKGEGGSLKTLPRVINHSIVKGGRMNSPQDQGLPANGMVREATQLRMSWVQLL